jgi:hypothetical protein
MDVFPLFGRTPKNLLFPLWRRGPADLKRRGLVVRAAEKSILFFDDATGREVFIPISKILDWWFSDAGTKRGLRIQDLELNDEITILIPTWLAKKESLV